MIDIKKELTEGLLALYRKISSGKYTKIFMDKHTPYSVIPHRRRAPFYGGQKRFINVRSGLLRSSYFAEVDAKSIKITNRAPYFRKIADGIPGLTLERDPLGDRTTIFETNQLISATLERACVELVDELKKI